MLRKNRMDRQKLADEIGFRFAALISGNNQPHMSGDPRARLHGERRRRFDETCLEVADLVLAAAPAQTSASLSPFADFAHCHRSQTPGLNTAQDLSGETKETRVVRDPFLNKEVEINHALLDRLRGRYAVGPTMPNGEPEFGWREFEVPPIQIEAADAIERAQKLIECGDEVYAAFVGVFNQTKWQREALAAYAVASNSYRSPPKRAA
jgi:hypothetical protein